jgi:hypothetical protein
MTETNEQYAYFSIVGDFDPTEITLQAGVTPTECWLKGDLNPKTQLERKFSRWSLHSRLGRACALEAHIADVIQQLRVNENTFVTLSSKYGGVLQLVAYFNSGYPGLHFDSGLVKALSGLKLSVDFDFYYLYSDRREDS